MIGVFDQVNMENISRSKKRVPNPKMCNSKDMTPTKECVHMLTLINFIGYRKGTERVIILIIPINYDDHLMGTGQAPHLEI